MSKLTNTALIVLVAGAAFAAGRLAPTERGALAAQPETKPAQPQPKPAPPQTKPAPAQPAQPGMDEKAMKAMQEMMAAMTPGAQHKLLDCMLGEWEGWVKFSMAPGETPMESKGTLSRRWILDGRFIEETVVGEGMTPETPFHGLGLVGYNTIDKRYESAWFENMSTWITTSHGTYDAAKKQFVFEGKMLDPVTRKWADQRSVIDVSDPNREVMTGWLTGPDGKPWKNFEGDFTRKAAK